jgi:hypothetical protein
MTRHGLDRWIRPVTGGPLLLVVIMGIYSVAILAGIFLAMRPPPLPDAHGTRQAVETNRPEGEAGPAPVQGTIAVDPSSIWTWKFFLLCGLAPGGVGLLIWAAVGAKSTGARLAAGIAGAASLAVSAPLSAYVVKDVKLDTLFKIDQLTFALNVAKASGPDLPEGSLAAGAKFLGCVGHFPTGIATMEADPKAERCDDKKGSQVKNIQNEIDTLGKKTVAIVLIGSADRQPLSGKLRSQYDSNMGLARRRAEWVGEQLKLPVSPLVLTTGPKETKDSASVVELGADRSVAVWVLWSSTDKDVNNRAK